MIAATAIQNEFQQNAVIETWEKALCDLARNATVKDWLGRVYDVHETWDRNASLNVEIHDRIWLETYGSAIAEKENGPSNIKKETELYDTVTSLKKGDRIIFSGEFISSKGDYKRGCVTERSLTRSGAIREPEFIFRFDRIEAIRRNPRP